MYIRNHCTLFQTRQPIFVQLLQASFRISQCTWLIASQRFSVENCIRTLSDIAKGRTIAIPTDLEGQVTSLFNKAAMLSRQTSKWLQAAKAPKIERSQSQVVVLFTFLSGYVNPMSDPLCLKEHLKGVQQI